MTHPDTTGRAASPSPTPPEGGIARAMSSAIPALRTDRLTLRAFAMDDFPAYRAFSASPEAEAVGGILTEREAWRFFTAHLGSWATRGYGWWMLDDGTGPVGFAGVHYPPSHPCPELGWVLYPAARDKGYATEAAAAARAWWQARYPGRLTSNIAFDNAPSIAVARRLGATTDGRPLAHNPDCAAWVHPEAGA